VMAVESITTYTMLCDFDECFSCVTNIPKEGIIPDGWQVVTVKYSRPGKNEKWYFCPKHNVEIISIKPEKEKMIKP